MRLYAPLRRSTTPSRTQPINAIGQPVSRVESALLMLLDGTGCVGEYCVSVRPDQPDSADHNNENDGKHDRVLSDVLTVLFYPEPAQS
jgi:hypothetical protein